LLWWMRVRMRVRATRSSFSSPVHGGSAAPKPRRRRVEGGERNEVSPQALRAPPPLHYVQHLPRRWVRKVDNIRTVDKCAGSLHIRGMVSSSNKSYEFQPPPVGETKLLKPILAWVMATAITSLLIVIELAVVDQFASSDGAKLFSVYESAFAIGVLVWAFVAGLSAIPALMLVWLVRSTRLRRGLTDSALAGASAALMYFLLGYVGTSDSHFEIGFLIASFPIGIAGAAGGFTYWHFAGRPRPPY
jgi:hypothetical protein